MRKGLAWATVLLALPSLAVGQGQKMPPLPPATPPAVAPTPAANAPAKLSLDDAIRLALQHNHALQAARTTILQNEAEEVTANLRPNPNLSWDSQFFPLFSPSQFSADYLENQAQFDVGISYLIERGKKRQHRLQAAKDQTAVTRSTVTDNERTLIFNTSQQFISVLLAQSTLDLAKQDAASFQQTVDISESRYKTGDMSESDLLKIKLQLLQFQSDLSAAKLVDTGFTTPVIDMTVVSDQGKRTEKVQIAPSGKDFLARRDNDSSLYQLDAMTVQDLRTAAGDVKEQPPQPPAKK